MKIEKYVCDRCNTEMSGDKDCYTIYIYDIHRIDILKGVYANDKPKRELCSQECLLKEVSRLINSTEKEDETRQV